MKTLFKWMGGKRGELPIIRENLPSFVSDGSPYTFIEPFVGAGAVYWDLYNSTGKNVINDYDRELILFYRAIAEGDKKFRALIEETCDKFSKNRDSEEDRKKQKEEYYRWRDLDRKGLENLSNSEIAARFWILAQLGFSGIRRFNKKGLNNVSFGYYKTLDSSRLWGPQYKELLEETVILNGDYGSVIKDNDEDRVFMFIDPPYLNGSKTYSPGNEFTDEHHRELAATLKSLEKVNFLMIVDDHPLVRELYGDLILEGYGYNYKINARTNGGKRMKHLIIRNY